MKFLLSMMLAAVDARAASTCQDLFVSGESAFSVEISQELIGELAEFYAHLQSLPASSEKNLVLQDFRRKFEEAAKFSGLGRDQIWDLIRRQVAKLETKPRSGSASADKQRDSLMHWRRMKLHDKVEEIGPYIDSESFFSWSKKDFGIYKIKTMEFEKIEFSDRQFSLAQDSWTPSIQMTPDRRHIILFLKEGDRKLIRIVDLQSKQGLGVDLGELRGQFLIQVLRSGKHLLVASTYRDFLFELPSLKLVEDFKSEWRGDPRHFAESLGGRYFVIVRRQGPPSIWDMRLMRLVRLDGVDAGTFNHIKNAFFTADSRKLTLVDHNSRPYDFDLHRNQIVDGRFHDLNSSTLHISFDHSRLIAETPTGVIGNPNPFAVFDNETGQKIPFDFVLTDGTRAEFHNPGTMRFSEADNKLYFIDSIPNKSNRSLPEQSYLFAFDPHTLNFQRFAISDEHFMMNIWGLGPDGKSLLGRINGGKVLEIF